MQLVEQHLVRKNDPRYPVIDAAAFASKNLYNQAMYQIRQAFIHEGKYLPYAEVFHRVKHMDCYKALPAKIANSILILVHKNWVSFFKALEAYQLDPSKFLARPRIPGYKDKQRGRNILIYDTQALGKRHFKKTGKLVPSGLPIEIETCITEWRQLAQVRIVPLPDGYMMEVVYEQQEEQAEGDTRLAAALDPGVDTLAALTSNKPGFGPLLVNGRPLKSENQFYNKQRASYQRLLPEGQHTSHRLTSMTTKRTRRVNAYLHTASRRIIEVLIEEGISTLVLGKNPRWKQEVNLGKQNNQQFVQLPHARFLDMLTYKAHLVGITVLFQEESYTSKASFLDRDPIPVYDPKRTEKPQFSGKREYRGLYRAKDGRRIHADVNGSYNILRKALPNSFGQGIVAPAVVAKAVEVVRKEGTGSSVNGNRPNG
ncbi:MAG TPA: transposase [Ktedonobacteraceae bacterium]